MDAGLGIGRRTPVVELRLAGELDVASAPELDHALDRVLLEGCTLLTLDLTEVSFMDAAGVGALVRTQQRLRETGGAMRLICGSREPRRILRLCGMEGAFDLSEGATWAREPARAHRR
jgi:anti-anti-sigma factor